MIELSALLLAIPIVCLLLLAGLPSQVADRWVGKLRQGVPLILVVQVLLAIWLTLLMARRRDSPLSISCFEWSEEMGIGFGIYLDGVSTLMLSMVSLVGLAVSRFSIRYLDGEAMQGRYFRWIGFTVGSVSLLVIAGNLLLFFAAWVMTSFGLHQLLLHYRHREAAARAAWTKFTISRIGDAFLIGALVLVFQTFGTCDLAALFAQAIEISGDSESQVGWSHTAIGWLLVLGAVTKSAQFPFHTWLPDTMETPTPVSALMHAGIVNAGGYLIIRMSPLIALSPGALFTLAGIGAFTACFAAVVMTTQPSIKRALAYSTIAQMGFMMLQCGLGAFSAAMLHILGHSFYKAYAFLSSGSLVGQDAAITTSGERANGQGRSFASLFGAAALSLVAFLAVCFVLGINIADKSGGLVLAFVICLAITTWGWRLLSVRQRRTSMIAAAGAVLMCFAYLGAFLGVSFLMASSVPVVALPLSATFLLAGICLAFCMLFLFSAALSLQKRWAWMATLRIHAANGFYFDALYQRVFGSLAKS